MERLEESLRTAMGGSIIFAILLGMVNKWNINLNGKKYEYAKNLCFLEYLKEMIQEIRSENVL